VEGRGAEGAARVGRSREGAPRRGALGRAALPDPALRHVRRRPRRRRPQEDRQERRQVPGALQRHLRASNVKACAFLINSELLEPLFSGSIEPYRWLDVLIKAIHTCMNA
jgi:hypothetical protein